MQIIKPKTPDNNVTLLSFHKNSIKRIEVVQAIGCVRESLSSRYGKFPTNDKPTILCNLAMFAMNSGIPVTNVKIAHKMIVKDNRFMWGLCIDPSRKSFGYGKLTDSSIDFVSAFPPVLENGKVISPLPWGNELNGYNSRLCIGYNEQNYFIMTIDKSRTAKGIMLEDLGLFASSQGMSYAMAFDGGGSLHMMVHGKTINKITENRPIPIFLAIWLEGEEEREAIDLNKKYKVYLSPSTQDKNIGVGKYGSEEFRMNQVADIVERELKRHGVVTYRNNPSWIVTQSVADSNAKNPDLHLAIHSNASTGRVKGCITFSHKLNNGASHVFAKNLYEGVTSISPWGGWGVKQGYSYYGEGQHLYETAYTKGVASLVELDFHDHEEGAKFIIDHIEDLGVSLAKSCLKTLELPWIDPVIEKPAHWAKKHLDSLVAKKIIDSPSAHQDLNATVSKAELFALLDKITK